jgi:hypothetical protein
MYIYIYIYMYLYIYIYVYICQFNGLLKLSKLSVSDVVHKRDKSSMQESLDLFVKEADDEIVLNITKKWVKAIIADFAVCPFTVEPERAGIPRGNVRYTVSRAKTLCEAYAEYWSEVSIMTAASGIYIYIYIYIHIYIYFCPRIIFIALFLSLFSKKCHHLHHYHHYHYLQRKTYPPSSLYFQKWSYLEKIILILKYIRIF